MDLNVDDLTPRERSVFLASCQLEDTAKDGRTQLMHDPEYAAECERLAALGWLERVSHDDEPVGYRLSPEARTADAVQSLIEQAQDSPN